MKLVALENSKDFSYFELKGGKFEKHILNGIGTFNPITLLLYPLISGKLVTLDFIFSFKIPEEYQPITNQNEKYFNSTYQYSINLLLTMCYPGEIYHETLHFCYKCSLGKYSFNPSDKECQICPNQALYCQGNITEIRPGFWRSPSTHIIYQCDLFSDSCL